MKKLSVLPAALAAAMLLTACANPFAPKAEEPPAPTVVEKPAFTDETYPRVDGSTATIPLSEGLVRELMGKDATAAHEFVHHTTTPSAYQNLFDGNCDMILVTPPSSEEEQQMKDSGKEYEVEMVVKDAFVFLINSENTVEDISVEQLQKIYKGEITNWKELGGEDAEIVAFQRPDNMGSQTLMYKLLVPQDEIADAPTELRPAGMGDLVDAVSSYDSGVNSIGYSVYYYANGMYTSPQSKLISVDGVYPTPETIADGSYPLVDGYYAVFEKSQPEDSAVRQLLAWLTSDEGQKMAADEGYVPLHELTK